MNKFSLSVSILAVTAGFFLHDKAAHATAPFSGLAVGPGFGTEGAGLQVTTPLWPNIVNLTTGYSGIGFGYKAHVDGQEYKAHIRLGGAPIYLSLYPVGPHFHLDAGIFVNQNKISLKADSTSGVYFFNGQRYTAATLGEVRGHTHFNTVAPYIGIGWGNPFFGSSHWTFVANAGVMFEGGARTRLSAANEDVLPGARQNIDSAARQFSRDVAFMQTYPVATIGLMYRF